MFCSFSGVIHDFVLLSIKNNKGFSVNHNVFNLLFSYIENPATDLYQVLRSSTSANMLSLMILINSLNNIY